MERAIFLDRDGTINVEKHYLSKIEDFDFIPGAIEGLRLLQDNGYLLIIITNQSGIGRGYFTEKDFYKLNDWMLHELGQKGIKIVKVYFCPHLPNAQIKKYRKDCSCRKPKLGMYEQAIKEFNIDISESWAIGDKIRDCSICEHTRCRGILIDRNEKNDIIESVKSGLIERICYADNLLMAAKMIVNR